ncbi:hypothetical protein Q5530_28245 [Saccharothrix sp. BKS2]|uniref:hypothetical protein n=1 Tax=Saccharothrix sp. BKS2 TaxID=3064400 RepID=UPI0039E9EDBB
MQEPFTKADRDTMAVDAVVEGCKVTIRHVVKGMTTYQPSGGAISGEDVIFDKALSFAQRPADTKQKSDLFDLLRGLKRTGMPIDRFFGELEARRGDQYQAHRNAQKPGSNTTTTTRAPTTSKRLSDQFAVVFAGLLAVFGADQLINHVVADVHSADPKEGKRVRNDLGREARGDPLREGRTARAPVPARHAVPAAGDRGDDAGGRRLAGRGDQGRGAGGLGPRRRSAEGGGVRQEPRGADRPGRLRRALVPLQRQQGRPHPQHDMGFRAFEQLLEIALGQGGRVVVAGDLPISARARDKWRSKIEAAGVHDLREFWLDSGWTDLGLKSRFAQFAVFDLLHTASGGRLKHLGFRSGNLEPYALIGHEVRYIEEKGSAQAGRMDQWKNLGYLPLVINGRMPTLKGQWVTAKSGSGKEASVPWIKPSGGTDKGVKAADIDQVLKGRDPADLRGFEEDDLKAVREFLKWSTT